MFFVLLSIRLISLWRSKGLLTYFHCHFPDEDDSGEDGGEKERKRKGKNMGVRWERE